MKSILLLISLFYTASAISQQEILDNLSVNGNITTTGTMSATGNITSQGSVTATNTVEVGNVKLNTSSLTTATGTDLSISTGSTTGTITNSRKTRFADKVMHNLSNDPVSGSAATIATPTTKTVRLTAIGDLVSIKGIPAGETGQELNLLNLTGADVTILNEDATATEANKIRVSTGSNFSLKDKASIPLLYDVVNQRWYLNASGGSAGQGGINYVSNSDFENGTTGWNTYLDTAGAAPLDGTGGTANITAIASASSPLRGAKSLLITKGAFNRQGEGVSTEFTIDPIDKKQPIKISFDVETSANYISGDIRIYVYDITNSKVIELVQRDLAAGDNPYTSFFQASPDSVNYRLIFHISSINATVYTVKVDNVRVEPKGSVVKGAVVTDKKSMTVTSNWPATLTADYKRIGDTADIEIKGVLTGTPTGQLTVTLPSSLTYTGEYRGSTSAVINLSAFIGGTVFSGSAYFSGSNTIVTRAWLANGTYVNHQDSAPTVPASWASGSEFYISIRNLKIAGWSSNMVLSEDSGNREVTVRAGGNGGQSITALVTNIPFSTSSKDTSSSWNGSQFTAPEKGEYDISGQVLATAPSIAGIFAYINGVQYKLVGYEGSVAVLVQFWRMIPLNKGDVLSFRSDSSFTLLNDPVKHEVTITKRSTPQTIALDHAKIEKCTDTYECTDSFTMRMNGASVTSENLKIIQSCVASGNNVDCTFVSGKFSVPPTVHLTPVAADPRFDFSYENLTKDGVRISASFNGAVQNANTLNYSLTLAKQGADYIGKTAKAVASDQNVRSIGSIGVDIQSVTFGAGADCSSVCTGTCTICRQVGTKITSVAHSGTTAIYYLNGIDGTKYSCSGNGVNAGFASGHPRGDLATTTRAVVRFGFNTSADNVAHAKVDCIGVP